jgi:type II secretory pathway component GspD/PulD (secretin)
MRTWTLALALISCATTPAPPRFIALQGFVVVPLESASADDVARTIDALTAASAKITFERTRGSCVLYRPDALWARCTEPEPSVRILADPATNSVLVKASPDDLEPLVELIARLDGRLR